MAITLTPEWQKVLEASTKVTSNVTGYLRLYMKYGGRDETNNKDIVYYEIRQYAYNPYGNYLAWEWSGDLDWNIKLGTTTKASGTYKQTPAIYSNGQETVRQSGNWEQPHNADGNWSSAISFEGYVYQTKVSASGDIILPTIPRATTILATDSKIGSISTIYLSINSDTFNHKLFYKTSDNGEYNTIITNYKGDNYLWEVPNEIYNAMPNSKEIQLTIICETYNSNNVYVGYSFAKMWASANESEVRPTFNVNFYNESDESNTFLLTGSRQSFIKDYTTVIIDGNVTTKESSSLNEYKVVNGNKVSYLVDTELSNIPTKTFTFYIKDSRGYYPQEGYPLVYELNSFIEYFTPKINAPKIDRIEQTSTEIVANISGQFWNGNFGRVQNTLKYAWRSKLAGSNEWGAWSSFTPLSTSNNNFSISNLSLGTTYATNSSYDFQFQFIDELGNLDSSKIITTATQNVTVSSPIVEVYEDAVNVNGNIMEKGVNLGLSIKQERIVYRRGTGSAGWYELFRLPSTSGWNGVLIEFELIGYSVDSYTRAYGNSYNANNYVFRYIENRGDVTLYYNRNSDNTISIYCYVGATYAPKSLKIIHYYNEFQGYDMNIFDGGYPIPIDEPSSKTQFGSF